MKRTLIYLALLGLVPAMLAIEPVLAQNPTSSPVPNASPVPGESPSPAPIRLQTLVADKNLRLTLKGIAPACQVLRVALLRKDVMQPGYGVFNRAVRVDQALGRVASLILGPEFQPHRYGVGEVRLSCFDAGGKPVAHLSNKAVLALDQVEVLVDVGTAFGPGAGFEKPL